MTNINKCVFVSVKLGAVSEGHLTDAGHVIAVLVPVTSTSSVKEYAVPLAGMLLKVKVELLEIDLVK